LVMNWALLLLVTCTAACVLLICTLCSSTMMKAFMKKLFIVTASELAGRGFPPWIISPGKASCNADKADQQKTTAGEVSAGRPLT
jgi:hypothetical protein